MSDAKKKFKRGGPSPYKAPAVNMNGYTENINQHILAQSSQNNSDRLRLQDGVGGGQISDSHNVSHDSMQVRRPLQNFQDPRRQQQRETNSATYHVQQQDNNIRRNEKMSNTDSKPPSFPSQIPMNGRQQVQYQVNRGGSTTVEMVPANQAIAPQPVQNVIQFNLRVNTNGMHHGGGIFVDGDANQHQQVMHRNSYDFQGRQQHQIGPSPHSQVSADGMGGGNGHIPKRRSKERRPASSKNQINIQGAQNSQTNWTTKQYGIQPNISYNTAAPSSNPYFHNNGRKLFKKRPQSANRKSLMAQAPVKQSQFQSVLNQQQHQYKTPQQHFRKNNIQSGQYPNSIPQKKHRAVMQQFHGYTVNVPQNVREATYTPLKSDETLDSAQVSSASKPQTAQTAHTYTNIPQINQQQLQNNQGMMPISNFFPYTKSMKMPNQLGMTKTLSAAKTATKYQAPSIFDSAVKSASVNKSKIPTVTLQSREDLYEQNMMTKMQINNLRHENRKINTKLLVLENQLAQKDKLFEDMYKAAFQQVRVPMSAPGTNPNQSASSNIQNHELFHPSSSAISKPDGHGLFNSSLVPAQTIYAPNVAALTNNQQSAAQHQQLYNSYKRTIREQSREIIKRDQELDNLRRNVKATQINQLQVENDNYRNECIRLREKLEQIMWEQAQTRAQQAVNTFNDEDTFKRDLGASPMTGSITHADKSDGENVNEVRRQYDLLQEENRELSDQLAQMEQIRLSQANEIEQFQRQLIEAQNFNDNQHGDMQNQLNQMRAEDFANIQQMKAELEEQKRHLQEQIDSMNQIKQVEAEPQKQGARQSDNEEINNLREQLAAQQKSYKDLEKHTDELVLMNQKGVQDLREKETQIETMFRQLQQKEQNTQERTKLFAEEMQAHAEQDKELAAHNTREIKALQDRIAELEQEVQDKDAQHTGQLQSYKDQVAIAEARADAAKAKASTKKKKKPVVNLDQKMKTNMMSSNGTSAFDRASESEAASSRRNQQQQSDRSDLEFTSAEQTERHEPLTATMQKQDSQEEAKQIPNKIAVDDKTVFMKDQMPISPQSQDLELNEDHPHVFEGYSRLANACQLNKITCDGIATFLFGDKYRPENKLSIRKIAKGMVRKLGMVEDSAVNFARYMVETSGITGNFDVDSDSGVINQEVTSIAKRVIRTLTKRIKGELHNFTAEQEEKMKLIIGSKLKNKLKETSVRGRLQRKRDLITEEQFYDVFDFAGLKLNTKTLRCCFIHILRISHARNENYLCIQKQDLENFIRQSIGQAADFTMTGSELPKEDDMNYSSDTEQDQEGGATKPLHVRKDSEASSQISQEAQNRVSKVVEMEGADDILKMVGIKHVKKAKSSPAPKVGQFKQAKPSQPTFKSKTNKVVEVKEPIEADSNEVSESNSDDFTVNETRSDAQSAIPEEVDKNNGTMKSTFKSKGMTSGVADDSINDRDMDSSINKQMPVSIPAAAQGHLKKVPEVPANYEVSPSKFRSQSGADNSQDEVPAKESNQIQMQKSKSEAEFEFNTVQPEHHSRNDNDSPGLKKTNTATNVLINVAPTGNSSSQGSNRSQDSNGVRRKRALLNIKVDTKKQYRAKQVSQKVSTAYNNNNSQQDQSYSEPQGSQGLDSDKLISVATNEPNQEKHDLVPLKPDVPPPFGITVAQEPNTAHSQHKMTEDSIQAVEAYEQIEDDKADQLDPLKPEVPTPFGIQVQQMQHSEYGHNESKHSQSVHEDDQSDKLYQSEDDKALLPLKPDVPLPFGITVAEEPQSTYDRKNSNPDLNQAQLGDESEDNGLLPMKPDVPLPFNCTVAEEPQSTYDRQNSNLDLNAANLGKDSEDDTGLLPTKPDVPLPFNCTVKEEPQSTYDRQNSNPDLNAANLGVDAEDTGLLPMKPDVPLPFNCTVAAEPQSTYDRKNSDLDQNEANLGADSDLQDTGLLPVKPDVPLPFNCTVAEEPQSTYDRQQSNLDLNAAQLGVDAEDTGLLPVKPDVPLPFNCTVAEEPQSTYDRKDSDPDLKEANLAVPVGQIEVESDDEENAKALDQAIIDKFQQATEPKPLHQTESIVINRMKTETTEEGFFLLEASRSIQSPMIGSHEINSAAVSPPPSAFANVGRKSKSNDFELNQQQRVVVEEMKSIQSSEDGYQPPAINYAKEDPRLMKIDELEENKASTEFDNSNAQQLQFGDITPIKPIDEYQIQQQVGSGSKIAVQSLDPELEEPYAESLPPSAQKVMNDSFGQMSSQPSAEKRPKLALPPLELLQLKEKKDNPTGIQVGELLTDRSHRHVSQVSQEEIEQVSDFRDENAKEEGNKDYSNTIEDDIEEQISEQYSGSGQRSAGAVQQPAQRQRTNASKKTESEIEEDYEF